MSGQIFKTPELPTWLELSEAARTELHATCLLTVRSNCKLDVGINLAATTLACRQIRFDPTFTNELTQFVRAELLQEIGEAGTTEEEQNLVDACNESVERAIRFVSAPLDKAESAAERLKAVPPVVCLVVFDYTRRGLSTETLRFDSYYGCGEQLNQQYLEWLGFFGLPGDKARIHNSITKDILREALGQSGIRCKANMTRNSLIESVRNVPGLVSQLIASHCPQQRELLPQWRESVLYWADRVGKVKLMAAALMKFMALSTMSVADKPFFRDLPTEAVFETAAQIYNGAERFMADQANAESYPAWELAREYERKVPRGFQESPDGGLTPVPGQDWPSRWRAAAQQSHNEDALRILEGTGRMVALKSSGIWKALGDGAGGYCDTFGNPFPPFAFDSGFRTSGVHLSECVELGLIERHNISRGTSSDC